jgi:hypothetical protein
MEKLQARMIIEILGRPKEYIVDSLKKLVTQLEAEKGVKVIEKVFHEPIPVEKSKDLFTSFTEVTVEFDSVLNYYSIMFAYMPANVEIVYPENITIKLEDLNFAGNKMLQRLHEYDAVVKNTVAQQQILAKKLREVAPHLFAQPKPQIPNQPSIVEYKEPAKKVSKATKTRKSKKVK